MAKLNEALFRKELAQLDTKLSALYDDAHDQIERGTLTDASAFWEEPTLGTCKKTDGRTARVFVPHQVNLLTTSIFYDRLYFSLWDFDVHEDKRIDSAEAFRKNYQMEPEDLLALIERGRAVPILDSASGYLSEFSSYFIQQLIYPLITKQLPYFTPTGYNLIVQVWQMQKNAFADPAERDIWGFLIDMASAFGIGASPVRPVYKTDIWDRRQLIFDFLGFDELVPHFHGQAVSLEEFFVAVGIEYNDRLSVSKYLDAFEEIDKTRLYSLYKSVDHAGFHAEVRRVNDLSKRISREVTRSQTHLKVLTFPVVFLFHLAKNVLFGAFGDSFGDALKDATDDDLKGLLKKQERRLRTKLLSTWQRRQEWIMDEYAIEVLELTRLQNVLKAHS